MEAPEYYSAKPAAGGMVAAKKRNLSIYTQPGKFITMQQTGTYGYLWNVHQDILRQCKQSPAFQLFNHNKIREFNSINGMRLQHIKEQLQLLVEKYVLHEEKEGKLQPVIKANSNGVPEYQFETEDMKQQYIKAHADLMSTQVVVKI